MSSYSGSSLPIGAEVEHTEQGRPHSPTPARQSRPGLLTKLKATFKNLIGESQPVPNTHSVISAKTYKSATPTASTVVKFLPDESSSSTGGTRINAPNTDNSKGSLSDRQTANTAIYDTMTMDSAPSTSVNVVNSSFLNVGQDVNIHYGDIYHHHVHMTPTLCLPFRRLTYPRNHNFVGRKKELALIDSTLQPKERGIQSCTVRGIAGIGKTQVAVEYTHRYDSAFDYVMWLGAQNPVNLATAFTALYTQLQIGAAATSDQQSTVEAVKQWFSCHSKWLLVFDNVEDWGSIAPYWPATGDGSILITTQNPEMVHFTKRHVELPSLSDEESCNLLFVHLGRDLTTASTSDKAIASSLSEELGGLPMAIAHVAGYISQSQSSLESFRLQFRERLHGSQIWNTAPMATTGFHSRSLGALWDIAIESLQKDSRKLLEQISFLNPDAIPEQLLLKSRGDVANFNQTIVDLRKRCLIDRHQSTQQPYVSVHRALQRNMLLRQNESTYTATFVEAMELVRAFFPRKDKLEIPDHHNWELYNQYLPQVTSLQGMASDVTLSPDHSMAFADMLSDAGHYLWHRGDLRGSTEALETARALCGRVPEAISAAVLSTVAVGLQSVANAIGFSKRSDGIKYALEAVRLRSQYPVADTHTAKILLANSWHDLGCTYLEAEEYEKVEECLSRSLEIKKSMGTEESMPFEFSTEYEDFAYLRLSQGRTDDALKLIQDAVRVAKNDEPANRSVVLQFRFDWAVILLNSGRFQEALEKAQESLEARENVLGKYAIHTLNSMYWVANALFHLGRLQEAEATLRSVLQRAEESQWSLENKARAKYRLVQVLLKLGLAGETKTLEQEVQMAFEHLKSGGEQMPDPHSDPITVFDSMVSIYYGRSTGQLWAGDPGAASFASF